MSRKGPRPSPRTTTRPTPRHPRGLPGPVLLGLILATAIGLHLEAVRAPFFADDYLFLDQVRHRGPIEVLQSPDPIGNFFRPVSRQVWFWLGSSLGGESPVLFHVANLALFLCVLLLLHALIRRALGAWPALVGTAFLAVHHCADVPVLWASGSQDLLAVAGSLTAILLLVRGRPWAAAPVMLLALLSKETVVMAPFVAVLAARRTGEPWRVSVQRAAPLFAALAVWAVTWAMTAGRRPAMGLEVKPDPAGFPAALVHLVHVAAGIEWPPDLAMAPWPVAPPLALILVAVALLAGPAAAQSHGAQAGTRRAEITATRREAIRCGVAWAILGAAPVAAVASIWSAYYYVFALCGVAFVVAALVAGRPAWIGLLVVIGIGWASHHTRALTEFSARQQGLWSTASHVNRHFLLRGMGTAEVLLQELRAARPTLPPRSTLFFAGIPAQVAFQAADGPLLRWAYRDTTLRSYFMGAFRLAHARRGPVFFFEVRRGQLREVAGRDSLERVGAGLFISEELEGARDVLTLASEVAPGQTNLRYQTAWIHCALGDTAAMRAALLSCGLPLSRGPAPGAAQVLERVVAGDTVAARSMATNMVVHHPLDPAAHGLLSDLYLMRADLFETGALEAFAARVLAPDDPFAWRRWGLVLVARHRDLNARAALQRYLQLGGDSARADAQVQETLRELARRLPGGELARRELQIVPQAR